MAVHHPLLVLYQVLVRERDGVPPQAGGTDPGQRQGRDAMGDLCFQARRFGPVQRGEQFSGMVIRVAVQADGEI